MLDPSVPPCRPREKNESFHHPGAGRIRFVQLKSAERPAIICKRQQPTRLPSRWQDGEAMLMNVTLICETLCDPWRTPLNNHHTSRPHMGFWPPVCECQRTVRSPTKKSPEGSFQRVLSCVRPLNPLTGKDGTYQLTTIRHSRILGINRRLMNSVTALEVDTIVEAIPTSAWMRTLCARLNRSR